MEGDENVLKLVRVKHHYEYAKSLNGMLENGKSYGMGIISQ